MWIYERKLQYPVKIRRPNPSLAKIIVSQLGGPDGELGAATRYLNQRYSMPYKEISGILTDVGTEELAHQEMIGAILHQLTRELTPEEIKKSGFDAYFVDHTAGVYPAAASGFPWNAASMQVKGMLTDIGTEELGHLEMVGALVHQLTRDLTPEEIKKHGFDAYFVDHTVGVYPQAAAGVPWDGLTINVTGDVIADLTEDMAAEQKARAVYDNILRLSDDPDVNNVIRFLRQREVVHYQRFGEALNTVQEKLDQSNVYYMNPAFPMNR